MTLLKWFLIVAVVGYVAVIALMYVAQRAMMYAPDRQRTTPGIAGFPQAEEIVLDTADGERILAWHVPPQGDKPVVLYFHGNGGALMHRVPRFGPLVADGTGLLAVSYRGYGGSSGSPSETGFLNDAAAAYAFAAARYPASRIVVWGESIGSGVAVALAATHDVAAVILEAPFTSALAIGMAAYPYAPVRFLMKDTFRSDARIGKVRAPILILHGEQDRIVPFSFGQKLFSLANEPKRFVPLPGGGHNDLDDYGALPQAKAFLREVAHLP
ncbi:MAG: alpha/beta hydrolase [Pseudorhodoplanes sp.]